MIWDAVVVIVTSLWWLLKTQTRRLTQILSVQLTDLEIQTTLTELMEYGHGKIRHDRIFNCRALPLIICRFWKMAISGHSESIRDCVFLLKNYHIGTCYSGIQLHHGIILQMPMTLYWHYATHSQTHIPWTKWPPFRRRYFQKLFREWKVLYSDKISLKLVPNGSIDYNTVLV